MLCYRRLDFVNTVPNITTLISKKQNQLAILTLTSRWAQFCAYATAYQLSLHKK